jgi:hypothetical protein
MKHFLAILYKKKLLKLFESFPALGSEPGSFFSFIFIFFTFNPGRHAVRQTATSKNCIEIDAKYRRCLLGRGRKVDQGQLL